MKTMCKAPVFLHFTLSAGFSFLFQLKQGVMKEHSISDNAGDTETQLARYLLISASGSV